MNKAKKHAIRMKQAILQTQTTMHNIKVCKGKVKQSKLSKVSVYIAHSQKISTLKLLNV